MNYVIKGQEMEPRTYPYYAENASKDRVYLVTDKNTGVIIAVKHKDETRLLGDTVNIWKEGSFTPLLKGTVLEVTL
jgi:hypothetical protein